MAVFVELLLFFDELLAVVLSLVVVFFFVVGATLVISRLVLVCRVVMLLGSRDLLAIECYINACLWHHAAYIDLIGYTQRFQHLSYVLCYVLA